jgi:S-adenosylmethionine hydrolase
MISARRCYGRRAVVAAVLLFPCGTNHIAVVTWCGNRRAALRSIWRPIFFFGPDNGLITLLLKGKNKPTAG